MKLLIIDDDRDLAFSLKKALSSEGYIVDTVNTGKEGSFVARTEKYDIAVIDYYLPDILGSLVVSEIRAENKAIKILILSGEVTSDNKVRLLELGADDYISKPFSYLELLARIRALMRRKENIKDNRLEFGDLIIDIDKYSVKKSGKEIYLTRKEFSLLELLIKNKGKVLSRSSIMECVWSKDFDPFSNTVESHVTNLRKKIGRYYKRNIIVNIPGIGYKIQDEQ